MGISWSDAISDVGLGKFMSSETLEKVVTTAKLRWSRPSTFNDPFDCQPRFCLPSVTTELIAECVREFEAVIDGKVPSLSFTNPLGRHAGIVSEALQQGRLTRQNLLTEFVEGVKETLEGRGDFLGRYLDEVVLNLQDVKILCLTRAFSNPLMWAHYADSHSGALAVFQPSSPDSPFSLAKPVNYTDNLPEVWSSSDFPFLISGQTSVTDQDQLRSSMQKILYTKATAWSYEKELRIDGGAGSEPNSEFELARFHMDDLAVVVFGLRYPRQRMISLHSVASSFYPKVRWYFTKLARDRSVLELEALM